MNIFALWFKIVCTQTFSMVCYHRTSMVIMTQLAVGVARGYLGFLVNTVIHSW